MTLSPGRIGMAVTLVLLALVYSVSIQDAVAASADKLDKGVKVGEAIPAYVGGEGSEQQGQRLPIAQAEARSHYPVLQIARLVTPLQDPGGRLEPAL